MDTRTMLVLILGCWAVCYCGNAFAQDQDIKESGVTEGPAIVNGVVILNGVYVSSPYTVSRKGLSLYVNDREIKRPRRHMQTPVLTPDTPISQLSAQERQRLYRALEATRTIYEKYLSQGYGYLFSSRGGQVKLSPHAVAYQLPAIMNVLGADVSREEKLNKLRRSNWHLHIDIEPLVDNFSPSPQLSSKVAQQAEELLRADEFGVGQAVSVAKGFIFHNGRYIEAPYVLQRRGLSLYLNDRLLNPPQECPSDVPTTAIDVAVPPEVDSESSWFDETVRRYVANKFVYLSAHYGLEQAVAMKAEVLAALPFVTRARRNEGYDHVLNVTTNEGLTIPCMLVSPSPVRGLDCDGVRQSVDKEVEHYARMLNGGVCYILSPGTRTCLSAKTVNQKLPRLIEILRSDMPSGEKRDKIKTASKAITDTATGQLVSNFAESAQLRTRIEHLGQSERLDRGPGEAR